MSPLRVAVAGCTGRMGQALVRLIAADPAFQLAGAVTVPGDPRLGQDVGSAAGGDALGVKIGQTLADPGEVLIEFTSPAGCAAWARWCADHGTALVSGTTGLNDAARQALTEAARTVPVLWSPNMSVGVNLLLALCEQVAGQLGPDWDVEIQETHHRRKVDAPSGTARALLEAVCAGRGVGAGENTVFGREGLCGPRPAGQIGVHALRLGAVVGEHEVHFASEHEQITLVHRALARETFAAGALRAARWLASRAPGMYLMRDVLGG